MAILIHTNSTRHSPAQHRHKGRAIFQALHPQPASSRLTPSNQQRPRSLPHHLSAARPASHPFPTRHRAPFRNLPRRSRKANMPTSLSHRALAAPCTLQHHQAATRRIITTPARRKDLVWIMACIISSIGQRRERRLSRPVTSSRLRAREASLRIGRRRWRRGLGVS